MAQITAAMVKDLREKTGVGMMDCKNALNETQGDIEAAIDWLRKKGLSKAAKKADRVAAEGLVALAVEGNRGVAVEVNSETDFVARNADFQKLVRNIAEVAAATGDDVETVKGAAYPAGGTVADAISNAIATIGENMNLRRIGSVSVKHGVIGQYMHNVVADNQGKIGVIVGLESTGSEEALKVLGRQIAMHIAAASPIALDSSSIEQATIDREKSVLAEKNAGKPAHVLEKIVDSGLKTFFKEVTLLEQAFIHDNAKSVTQAVKESEKTVGAPVTVTGFVRFALGEGVEKGEGPDFAAEVASLV